MSNDTKHASFRVSPGLASSRYAAQIEGLIAKFMPAQSEDSTAWIWVKVAVESGVPQDLAEDCARAAVRGYRYQCSQEASKKG